MTFKQLAIGEVFRFAEVALGELCGPWVKVAPRHYVLRLNHGKEWESKHTHEITSVRFEVIRVEE